MTDEVLTTQQLNRASLARQYLLERCTAAADATLEHLVGLQAQEPQEPYVGLWSRLNGSSPPSWSRSWRTGTPYAPRSCAGHCTC